MKMHNAVFADAAALAIDHDAALATIAPGLQTLLHAFHQAQVFGTEHVAVPLHQLLLFLS
ncbi:hypothetical protein D3C84_1236270 [compost metagenome]